MAGLDATQVRVAVTGKLLVAPVGTTAPTDIATPWAAGWTDLGYLSDKGPKVKPGLSTKDVNAWQSFYAVRTIVTERTFEATFELIQKSGSALKLAFGGGTVTALGGGIYRYSPPSPSTVDERMVGIEVTDGTLTDRYVMARAMVTATGDITFAKEDAVAFEVTVKSLNPTSGDVWNVHSNDPAMAS